MKPGWLNVQLRREAKLETTGHQMQCFDGMVVGRGRGVAAAVGAAGKKRGGRLRPKK